MNAAQQHLAALPIARSTKQNLRWLRRFALAVLLLVACLAAFTWLAIGPADLPPTPSTLATAGALLLLAIVAALLLTFASPRAPAGQMGRWLAWLHRPGSPNLLADVSVGPARASLSHSTADRTDSTPDLDETVVEMPAMGLPGGEDPGPRDEDEVVLQHIVRMRDKEGREYIHATLRGEIAAGHRHATLYLGFCPPFPTLPQVEAEVIEGPPAITKVVQALHNGVQIDVELDEAVAKPVTVVVEAVAYESEAAT